MSKNSFIGNEDDDDLEFERNDFEFDTCECEDEEPKDKHGISILMNVNSKDAGVIRDALTQAGHVKIADDFETRRELGIMHELKEKGWDCIFESWEKDTYGGKQKRTKYKMKHKVLAK